MERVMKIAVTEQENHEWTKGNLLFCPLLNMLVGKNEGKTLIGLNRIEFERECVALNVKYEVTEI